MNNLLALIKVDLKETLDTRKFKENKAKSTSFLTFVVLFLILGIFLSVVYNLMFTSLFHMAGESLVYPTILMAGLTSLLTFSTSVFKVKSIFIGKLSLINTFYLMNGRLPEFAAPLTIMAALPLT